MCGERFRRHHNNSSKQQQSQPNKLRCRRRRRSAWPLVVLSLFPSHLLTCSRSFYCNYFCLSATQSINCIYLNPPRSRGPVRKADSIEISVYIALKTSGIRSAVSKKGNHPSSPICKRHSSKHTAQRTRCTLVSESTRSYCSATVEQYHEETTQKVRT